MAWRRLAPPGNTIQPERRQASSAAQTSIRANELSQCWKDYRQPVLTGSAGFAIRSLGTPHLDVENRGTHETCEADPIIGSDCPPPEINGI